MQASAQHRGSFLLMLPPHIHWMHRMTDHYARVPFTEELDCAECLRLITVFLQTYPQHSCLNKVHFLFPTFSYMTSIFLYRADKLERVELVGLSEFPSSHAWCFLHGFNMFHSHLNTCPHLQYGFELQDMKSQKWHKKSGFSMKAWRSPGLLLQFWAHLVAMTPRDDLSWGHDWWNKEIEE